MTLGGPSAADITVAETLALLDGPFDGLAKGVAEGRYAFWLGSGIPLKRVPGLVGLVVKTLEFLGAHVDPALGEACPHRKALVKAVALARMSEDDAEQIDLTQPASSWPPLDQLLHALCERYSRLLGIRVEGKPRDYLLWEGVDVRTEYGACAKPDCEHVAFAMLVLEGVAGDAPTPNWDGLIEVAIDELSSAVDSVAQVVVLKDEVPTPGRHVRVLKFHGCAVLARRDPARYRHALVAQRSQITEWPHDPETAAVQNELVSLATTKPTLMIGLSAQDANIQDIFAAAKAAMTWPWPSEVPAHVFSGEALGDDHANILRIVYGEAYARRRWARGRDPCRSSWLDRGRRLLCEQRPDARREPLGVDQAQHVAARFPHLDAGGGDELDQPALVVCLGRGAVQREQWCGDPGQDGFGDLAQLLGRRRQQRRYARPSGRDRRAVCSRVRAGVNAPEAGTRRRALYPVAGLPGRACAAALPRQPR
jgi:hypothetical protein